MNKRTILLGLALFAAASMVFAGGKSDTVNTNDPMYPIEISVYTIAPHQQPPANNPFFQKIKDELKVTFKFDILVGDAYQKRGVMIASGDYDDILEINETAFIDAGAVIPLEDLIVKYAPNVEKHIKETGNWEKIKSPDGHIYHIPNYGLVRGKDQNPLYNQSALWVQKEILKDAGYPKVVTMDQYFDLLINYAKKNPTINGAPVIPFTILTFDWHAFCLWNPPNFLAGFPNEGNGTVDPRTYKYENFFTQDISKRWFKKLNDLYAQGYLDRSAFTDDYDTYLSKLASGRVLGMHDQGWQFENADFALRDSGRYNRTFAPLPIVFDSSIKPRYRNIPIPNIGRGFSISVKAKDPVRIMRFLNEYMSEKWQRIAWWGIEGKDWQYDSKKVPYRTEQQRKNVENREWQYANMNIVMRDAFPNWEGSFSDGYPNDLANFPPERESLLRSEDKELFKAYSVNNYNELMDKNPPPNALWFPTWNMPNPPDGSPALLALRRMEETMKRMLPQVITAPPAQFEATWTRYVNQLKADGTATYEAYMQEQLNARIKAWSPK